MFNLKRCALLAVSATIFSAQAQLADENRSQQIEEISVIGQFVPDEKRSTDAVANVVNSEEFTRTGDANIAESLKRVAGLSTVGGKYVYVRGLGERYSTTLLNGALLPSPEPINRVVPLDLFPTAVLDSVLVQKTYSARFPSEFGGGVLQMRTKKSTDEFFFNVTGSTGMVQNAAFKDGWHMSGGDTDWLGMDDGWRDKSAALQDATANSQELRKYSPFSGVGIPQEQLDEVGRSFKNQYTPELKELPPNASLTLSTGNFHEIGDSGAKINYLAAVNYSNSWDTDVIERNSWVPGTDGMMQFDGLTWTGTEHSIDTSGIFTTGIDFNFNHNVRLTSVVLRKTDNLVGRATGFVEDSLDVELNESRWIERELFSNQIQGDHYFPELNELTVNWRLSKINAERDAPDERIYRRDNGEFSSRVDGNLRNWSTLDDEVRDFGLDLSMTFYGGPGGSTITTRAGYMHVEKERESEIRRFGFAFAGAVANDIELLVRPLEEILVPANIVSNGFTIREITRPTDNYQAQNTLDAVYGEVEFNFDDRLRFTLGGRQEKFEQFVDTFDLFRPGIGSRASQETDKLLPSVSLTYIAGDHQFRLGYSQTVSRPDFRELSPAAFTNPINGRDIIGNPNLKITELENFDLRWEWYFGFSDYVSAGLFYKEFTNPIEASIVGSTQRAGTYINAQGADNAGAEFEVYKRLDFLGDGFLNGIGEDFYIQANASVIDSEVSIAEKDLGVLTSSSRPLQGQSDYLFNFQFGYEPVSGTTATLLYHYYGERIYEVGIETAPDLVEQPFGELNFVLIRDLSDDLAMTLKARNLTDQRNEITQAGYVNFGYNRGREFSFQLDYSF
ncbi:MAG: TonB-dependent receptor [Pseudomonadota bacterium]|nr:TonB-dependent receptor [Pseudomonadota bacterium]